MGPETLPMTLYCFSCDLKQSNCNKMLLAKGATSLGSLLLPLLVGVLRAGHLVAVASMPRV